MQNEWVRVVYSVLGKCKVNEHTALTFTTSMHSTNFTAPVMYKTALLAGLVFMCRTDQVLFAAGYIYLPARTKFPTNPCNRGSPQAHRYLPPPKTEIAPEKQETLFKLRNGSILIILAINVGFTRHWGLLHWKNFRWKAHWKHLAYSAFGDFCCILETFIWFCHNWWLP